MNIKHFKELDEIRIQLNDNHVNNATESNLNVLIDLDASGNPCSIVLFNASSYIDDLESVSIEDVPFVVPTITVEQFARTKDMTVRSVQQLLQNDEQVPHSQRRLPGAYKEGKIWRIPVTDANHFVKSKSGRPKARVGE